MTARRPKRDPYLEVCDAARTAIERANAAQLTVRQHRTLLAVLHFTALRSYLAADVWLAQIAATAYAVDRAEDWQLDKTRADMKALQTAGILTYRPPAGRTSRPGYRISLTPADPGGGSTNATPTRSGGGSTGKNPRRIRKSSPAGSGRTSPSDPGQEPPSDLGGPTEGLSEALAEGEVPRGDDASPTGTASGGPSADAAHDRWDEEHEPDPDRLTKTLEALIPDGTPTGVDDDLDAHLIDRHLAHHVPDLRELIAIEIDTDELTPGQIRLALRSARTTTDRYSRHLPKLTLPRRSTR